MSVEHGQDLLPAGSSSDWMRAVAEASGARAVPVDALIAAMDPWRCPPHLLGWLASVFSVDLWFADWPERKKREVIAASIILHRLKGTLAGIKAHLDLVDCKVRRVVTPPAKFFLSSWSAAKQRAWLASLPEIRVYHGTLPVAGGIRGALADHPANLPEGTEGVAPRGRFLSDLANVETEGQARFCLARDAAAPKVRDILRAELIEDGIVTPLEMESANEIGARQGVDAAVERLYFPGRAGRGLFLSGSGGGRAPGFLDHSVTTDARHRRYAAHIRRRGEFADAIGGPVVRGREVVDDDPIRVPFEASRRRAGFFLDRPGRFFTSASLDRSFDYYESWRLVDGTKPKTLGPRVSYLDHDRFSIPPYTAEITVDFTERAPRGAFFLNHTPLGRGYAHRHDYRALQIVCEVVRVAKARRDVVLLDLDYDVPKPMNRIFSLDDLTMR